MPETLPLLAAGCVLAFCVAGLGCAALRAFAVRRKLLDHPNGRSLHAVAVPRLGGVAIAFATWLAFLTLHLLRGTAPNRHEFAWLITSIPVFGIGLVDDVRPLRPSTRLFLQFGCAVLFCILAGIPRGVSLITSSTIVVPATISWALWVFFIVAVLNIFNFMDGMDGLAGAQALGGALGIGVAVAFCHQPALATLCALIVAASAGFLFHNFPPAKIFMGDAGSTFLGFTFGGLAVAGAGVEPSVPFPVWLFALAPFLLDGASTLVRRGLRGERVWEAHRTHLYQRAVLSGRSHRDVLCVYGVWIAVASVAAVLAVLGHKAILVALVAVMFAALGLVRSWVRRCERQEVRQSASSSIQSASTRTGTLEST